MRIVKAIIRVLWALTRIFLRPFKTILKLFK